MLATTPALPGGLALNQPPEIDGVIAATVSPFSQEIIAEPVQYRMMTLTATQLLALKTGGGIAIAPRPGNTQGCGVGLACVLKSVSFKLNFKTTAYTLNAGTLKIFLGPPANAVPVTADLSAILTVTATSDLVGAPAISSGAIATALAENLPLYIGNVGTADFTLGDGTLDVIVGYTIVQM